MAVAGAYFALRFGMLAILSCFFQRITERNPVTGEPIPSTDHGYGLMSRESVFGEGNHGGSAAVYTLYFEQCIVYSTEEEKYISDGWIVAARVLAVLSVGLGALSFVFLIFSYCLLFTPLTFERWAMWILLHAAMAMAMSIFCMYERYFCHENECRMGPGTTSALSGLALWLILAATVKYMGHQSRLFQDDNDEMCDAMDDEEATDLVVAESNDDDDAMIDDTCGDHEMTSYRDDHDKGKELLQNDENKDER